MSIEALKAEVQILPTDERRKLMAFMVGLENEERAVQKDAHATLAIKEDDYFPVRKIVGRPR